MAETALPQYERLESLGLWKESDAAQRKEVIVSFGAASLVLSDGNGKPLTHWSLAAVRTLNPGTVPTLFSPDHDSGELLEIDDRDMIDAIARVRTAIRRGRPNPGRLRWVIGTAVVLFFAALTVFWLPLVSADYAARIIPQAKAEEIGETLMHHAERMVGQPCASPSATDALHRFERWLLPDGYRIQIVDLGARFSTHLPDRQILINRVLLEEEGGPEVAAGFVLLEHARMQQNDPMRGLFHHMGLRGTLAFLANGHLKDTALATYAGDRMTAPMEIPPLTALIAEFERAQLTTAPFARAIDATGQTTADLIAQDPVRASYRPGIDDSDWIALQDICGTG